MKKDSQESLEKCLNFIAVFEETLRVRPGMLGSAAEISGMFHVIDNMRNILLFGELLPRELSWIEFLIERKLLRDLKPIPIEDNWNLERFASLRTEYLAWVDAHRASF